MLYNPVDQLQVPKSTYSPQPANTQQLRYMESALAMETEQETTAPLDTFAAFKYLWLSWRFLGMHPFDSHRRLYWAYSFLVNLCFTVLFPLHLVANLFVTSDFVSIIANLGICISSFFSTIKQITIFYYSRRNLWRVRQHLRILDERAASHSEERELLERAVRFCRRMFVVVFIAYTFALIAYGIAGLVRHQLPFEGWLPFDWAASQRAYLGAYCFQIFGMSVQLIQNLSNDTYGVSYLAVLVAQVQALNLRIARIGTERGRHQQQSYGDLVQCVHDHRVCTDFFERIRPVISGTMLIQFLITGFVLCILGVGIVMFDESLTQQAPYIVYIGCVLIEILPCCWYMDELSTQSHRLTTVLYECRWYEQDQRFRDALIIFMQRSQKAHTLSAGNLAPVTLTTVRSIIQFAFSMFTIIIGMK